VSSAISIGNENNNMTYINRPELTRCAQRKDAGYLKGEKRKTETKKG
jgi:hypothetical protein